MPPTGGIDSSHDIRTATDYSRPVPLSESEIKEECAAAIADAGYLSEEVRFFRVTGNEALAAAAWFRPFCDIDQGAEVFAGDHARLEEANSDESRKLHRIVIPASPTDRVLFAALVRHELEHALQWDAMLGIFDLHDFIEHEVLPQLAGDLDCCRGGLVNTIPTEIDCNAAASVYIHGRFKAEEVHALRQTDRRLLACSRLRPPPRETLPGRMIAFTFIHRVAVQRLAEVSGFSIAALLRRFGPGAPAYWQKLEQGLSSSPN
jgi:hypothetical protein